MGFMDTLIQFLMSLFSGNDNTSQDVGSFYSGSSPSLRPAFHTAHAGGSFRLQSGNFTLPIDGNDQRCMREDINTSIQAVLAHYHGTRYEMGGKDRGGIDCSGFVKRAIEGIITGKGTGEGPLNLGFNAAALNTNSEGQIVALSRMGGDVLDNEGIKNNLRGGMVLAMDTGHKGWDAGRANGVDHIVVTFEGEDGKIYVAHSTGGKGVTSEPALDYIQRYEARGTRFLGVDLAQVAAASQEPKPEMQLAAAPAAPTSTHNAPI